ncbi:hypothetical protein HG530_002751 [Fusarium avenaceum]|nr:hypothetical protein HG530_002751 [Fusarium avenaceum]
MFGVPHNAWDFTTSELWTAAPALTIIAAIAWALPLIAVITPATLSIEISSEPNVTVVDSPIPNIDYDQTLWFGEWLENRTVVHSVLISRLLLPVATLGYILNAPAPFPNSSYSVEFYGPSISCETPNNRTFTDRISKIIANHSNSEGNVTYVGFVPYVSRSTYPFVVKTWEDYAIEGLYVALNYTQDFAVPTLDTSGYEMDEEFSENNLVTFFVVTPGAQGRQAKNTLMCQLYNSSYAINFTFDNGLQKITYKTERLNGVTTLATENCRLGRQLHHCNLVTAYLSLMNAMGELLLGAQWYSGKGVYPTHGTEIGRTTLIESPDMNYFHYERPKSSIKNMSMADALEELLPNVTISLLSESNFLQNDTSASYHPITRYSPQNEFSYESRNLFIAYGIGILFSSMVVVYGLLCIKSASASYANSFSTILRTTRNPDLDAVIPATETSGAEPLSKNLGNVRLVLRRQGNGLEGGGGEATFFVNDPKPADGKRTCEETPTESLLKQNTESHHSDIGETPNTQEGLDVNLKNGTQGALPTAEGESTLS